MKRLTRVAQRQQICGVCTGIGRYLNIDPVVIRLLFVLFACMGGSGLLAYFIAAVIIPKDDGIIDAE